MATIKIVPKEDWEVIREYLYADNGGAVILVPEEKLENFSDEQAEALRAHDGDDTEYGFGGEPDFYVDVLEKPDTFCADEIISEILNNK